MLNSRVWITLVLSLWAGTSVASEREAFQAFQKKQYDKAVAEYQKELAHDPENARKAFNLGVAQYSKGDREHALQNFRKAQQTGDPSLKADAFYNEAADHFIKGDKPGTETSLKQALSYNPEHQQAKALQKQLIEQKPPEQKQDQKNDQKKDQQQKDQQQDPSKQQNDQNASQQKQDSQQQQNSQQQTSTDTSKQNSDKKDEKGKDGKDSKSEPNTDTKTDTQKDVSRDGKKSDEQKKEDAASQASQNKTDKPPTPMPSTAANTNTATQTGTNTAMTAQQGKPSGKLTDKMLTPEQRDAERSLRKVEDKVMRYLWEAPGSKGKNQQEEHPW